jgi:pimeloyl-ACP methyl ester carboxylesterase
MTSAHPNLQSDLGSTTRLERGIRLGLRAIGVCSRYVETEVARHHVYDAVGRGALPPIVLLPGLSDAAPSLVPVLLHLRGPARRVLIIESAGHGLSGTARGEYTVARHLTSMTAALDQLLDAPAVLAGNSLGGATALSYALERPTRVCGLYLTSPAGAPLDDVALDDIRRAFTMRTTADARAFLDRVFHRSPLLAPAFARLILARASSTAVGDILRSMSGDHPLPENLADLTMPLTLVWGRSERLLPPSSLAYLRDHLPAHAVIAEPDGFGHCPHLDNPMRLARMIAAFASSLVSDNQVSPH